MKTITTIMTIVTISLFAMMTSSSVSAELSPEMATAIEISKKVEAKQKSLAKSFGKFANKIVAMSNVAMQNGTEKKLETKYEGIMIRIDNLLIKHADSTSIYKWITLNLLEDLKVLFREESHKINMSAFQREKDNESTLTETQKKIVKEVSVSASTKTVSVSEQRDNKNELINNWVSKNEATILSNQTSAWDSFKFCANFPAEVYTDNSMRMYRNAQSPVAKEYYAFMVKYFKNVFTDAVANRNWGRIQQCVSLMYSHYLYHDLTQDKIKELYERTYNEEYTPYTTPFYLEGVQPENIEAYISDYQGR